jgi:MFS family permease
VDAGNPNSPRKRAIIGLNLSSFFWAVGQGTALPVIPILSYQLEPNVAMAGIVTAIGGTGRLLVSYFSGPLMDRFGRKNLATLGIVIRMIFAFLEGIPATWYHLAAYRFMAGVGGAIYSTGLATITADVSTRQSRGTITGGRMSMAQFGGAIGPLLGGAAWAITGDIRVPFFLNGLSKLICLIIFLLVMQETKNLSPAEDPNPKPETAETPARSTTNLRSLFFSGAFFFVLYGVFASEFFRQGMTNVVLPLYARNVLELSQMQLGLIISAISVGSLLAALPSGFIVDRLGIKMAVIPGALLAAIALVLIAQNVSGGVPIILAVMMGVGSGAMGVGTQAYAIDLSPREGRGAFFGKVQAARYLATLLGPLFVGSVVDYFGYGFSFNSLAILFLAMLPLSLIFVRDTPRPMRE